MTLRIASTFKLGVAAALTFGLAATAAAQVQSDRPIRVTKDAPAVARVDTVTITQFRVDTVRVFRTDTLRVTNTVYDTTRIETMPGWMNRVGGLYFGLGAGVTAPGDALELGNSTGWNAQAQLGVDPIGSPLGLRVDVNYAQLGETPNTATLGSDPDILNVNGDLKLKIPMFRGRFPNFAIYGIGGASYIRYKELRVELDNGQVVNNDEWADKWGWNAGGGASLQWGARELFLEARVIQFKAENSPNARQFPVVLGFNWF